MTDVTLGWLLRGWIFGGPVRDRLPSPYESHSERAQRAVVRASSDDATLIELVRAGDETAVAQLWHQYHRSLEAFAERYLQSPDMACDAVQEVFVRLWVERRTFAPRVSIAAYLYRSVWHVAHAQLRRVRVRQQYAHRVQAAQSIDPPVAINTGEAIVAAADAAAEADRFLARMTPRVREIFLLSRRDGLRAAEIAETLGVGVQVVYNQLARAAKILAEGLEESGRED